MCMRNSEMCKGSSELLLQRIMGGGKQENSSGACVLFPNLIFKCNQT